jgi:subtilase family serine protease
MKWISLKHSAARSLCLCAVAVAALPSALAQSASPVQQLVTTPVNETSWVTLAGNTRPEANTKNDRGAVSDSLQLQHMLLQLKRPVDREAALTARIEAMSQPGNPLFHQWLTAEQIGTDYGLNPSDLTAITTWMQSHGFQINSVAPSGLVIDFSGTAAQVKSAFKTELHTLSVNGATHIANMQDPQIPAALANTVAGVASLNDFRPKPANRGISTARIDGATKAVVPQTAVQTAAANTTTPADTVSSTTQLVVPDDLHTIYNFEPVYREGITGKDQTIVVLEDTDVYSTTDWDSFRSTFGLTKYKQASFTQAHPGGCTDPGDLIGNDGEAILDAEYATAAAPDANIVLASCADTQTTFGGLLALQALINQRRPPSIISISYGQCEQALGSTGNAAFYETYQQAAAEGVSVFAAAGDNGAASCDADSPNAVVGIAVSGLASTPYNVAVGGTDFSDTYSGTNAQYWKKKDNSTYGSAKSYTPEIPWNDSCASTLIANTESYAVPYGSTGFCNATLGREYFLTTAAGSGGPSICGTGNPSKLMPSPADSGTCQGYAKPNYQAGAFGNPSDGLRDLPDVSLFAANGVWGHYYAFCYSQPATGAGGAPCTGDPSTWSGAGGTSFAPPILAGIQALVNQSTGTPQGNPNYVYYALGRQEYRGTGNNSCNSSLGNGIDGSCTFNDVTMGDNDVPCAADIVFLYDCYRPSGFGTVGVLSVSSSAYEKAYNTQPGWDFSTGLGTVNVDNLVTNWRKAYE